MKGGAIPLAIWATLIAGLFAAHWLWTGDTLQNGAFGFALGLIVACGTLAVLHDRDAIRPGPPEPDVDPQTLPSASLGAVVIAAAVVACGFGLVFGAFLVFISAGILAGGIVILARELAGERRARTHWTQMREPHR
jgi:hypothetical protein